MKFKAKIRRIGNSQGIYIPKNVITNNKIGDEIELQVITSDTKLPEKPKKVITLNKSWDWCEKHSTSRIKCGCK
jgi:antitoxin component of MazEF toxin-antitoxin module